MFGSIGLPELLLIFVIALLLFGPKKLPDIGKSLGKAMGEFRRASNDLQRSLEEEVAADELKAARREIEEIAKPVASEPVIATGEPQAQTVKPENPIPKSQPEEPTPPTAEPK
jgi:TatA/E family protein of Tat protein translocase